MGLASHTTQLNHMRASLPFFSASLLIGLTIFAACKSDETLPVDRVQLATNQSGRLASGVTVRVDTIQDSRCPQGGDIVCIWEGNAVVSAVLSKDVDSKRVRLVLGDDFGDINNKRPDSTGVSVGGGTYKVILRDVTPFPTGNQPVGTKQALIQITQL